MKSGYVAIIGKPNVGKSTLMNFLVGIKLSGVSPKPQTTRGTVRGILTSSKGQIVFVDTAGWHDAKDLLNQWMIREIRKALDGIDLLYWMIQPGDAHPPSRRFLEEVQKKNVPVFLLINQIDRFPKEDILPMIARFSKLYDFKEVIPISAKKGVQTDLLIEKTLEHLPEGEPFFEEDQLSDQNERDLVQEIIREKIFLCTGHEIPYASAVMIEKFEDREDGIAEIHATVVVERDSQKAIVIGKNGLKMKEIGQASRLDLEKLLRRKVFLKLWVKVISKWTKDPEALRRLGYGK